MDATQFDFEGFARAMEKRDVEGLLSYFADDVEVYVEDREQPFRGKYFFRQMAELALPALESFQYEPKKVITSGNEVAILAHFSGRYGRDLTLPSGRVLPVGGKSVSLDGAMFLTLDQAGKIQRLYRIRDNYKAYQQLGISPELVEELTAELTAGARI